MEAREAVQRILLSLVVCGVIIALADGVEPVPGEPLSPEGAPADSVPGLGIMDAVKETLRQQPAIRLQESEVDYAKGALQAAGGDFDWTLESSLRSSADYQPIPSAAKSSFAHRSIDSQTNELKVGFMRKSRLGMRLDLSLYGSQLEALNYDADSVRQLGIDFSIVFPLLKGSGRVAAAPEDAARENLKAVALDLKHEISTRIHDTVVSYWNYLAAQEHLRILEESERAASQLAHDIAKLAEADERPESDLIPIKATLAERKAQRIGGEQALEGARHELGIAMGIPGERIVALPKAAEVFPPLPAGDPFEKDATSLVALALVNRADLLSLRRREKMAGVLVAEARDAVKPSLDLVVGSAVSVLKNDRTDAAYAGLNSNYVDFATDDEVHGYMLLRFSVPLGNNAAKGALAQSRARYGQTLLHTEDLERRIVSRVGMERAVLGLSIQQTSETERSVTYYLKTVENEKKKFRTGMSTIIDVIEVEDRLRQARLSSVSSRRDYANSLANLRYATGTLLRSREADGESVTLRQLITYPDR